MSIGWRRFWPDLRRRRDADRDLQEELHAYEDLLADEYHASGQPLESARRAARIALGGREQVTELVRDVWSGAALVALGRDITYGVRLFRRTPAFSIAAIASIALAVMANSAVFGLRNALALRSLPVPQADQLAAVRLDGPRCCRYTGRNRQVSLPLWRELQRRQQPFSQLFAFADTRFNLAPVGEVRYVEGLFVSDNFFSTLGVPPARGRTFVSGDDRPGCVDPGAVISHALWQTEFGGRDDVLSQRVRLRTASHPIVGVMPAEFFGVEVGRRFEVALPLCAAGFDRADHWWLAVMGRLKPGFTVDGATASMSAAAPELLSAVVPPNYNAEQTAQFVTLKLSAVSARNGVSVLRTQYDEPLWLLMAIAGLVLLTACANIAGLSLVRARAREAELGLRLALGASRLRLVRQLLVEGLLIAVAGAAAGLLSGRAAQNGVLALLSTGTDRVILDLHPDGRVLAFTAFMIAAVTAAFTLAPLRRVVTRAHIAPAQGRTTADRPGVLSLEMLVAIQVTTCVALVSGATLFVLTARNLVAVDPGFDPAKLLFAHIFMTDDDPPAGRRTVVQRDLMSRLLQQPGITAVASTSTPPLGGFSWGTMVRVPDEGGRPTGEANRNQVSAGYFAAMRSRLIAGRDFSDADTPVSPKVAVVNESFARTFFNTQQPLGRRFLEGGDAFEVVGVVNDSKLYDLREDARPIAFTSASQVREPSSTMRLVVRTSGTVGEAIDAVRRVTADFVPSAGVRFASGEDVVAGAMQRERLMARLATIFGGIAIVLAGVGVYGVAAYTVLLRRREIAIRVALGGTARQVITSAFRRIAALCIGGLIIGIILTVPVAAAARSLLYHVTILAPAVVGAIVGIVCACVVMALWMPVRRALKTDPARALGTE